MGCIRPDTTGANRSTHPDETGGRPSFCCRLGAGSKLLYTSRLPVYGCSIQKGMSSGIRYAHGEQLVLSGEFERRVLGAELLA